MVLRKTLNIIIFLWLSLKYRMEKKYVITRKDQQPSPDSEGKKIAGKQMFSLVSTYNKKVTASKPSPAPSSAKPTGPRTTHSEAQQDIGEDIEALDNFNLSEATIENANKYFRKLDSQCQRYNSMGTVYLLNPTYIRLKKLLFVALEFLCKKDPVNVVDHRQERRVWSLIHKELSAMNADKASTEEKEDAIKNYFKACDEAANGFMSCFNILQDKYNPLVTPLTHTNKIRELAGHLLLYVGDLMRYQLKYIKKEKEKFSPADYKKLQAEVLGYYTRAKTLYPFEGKIYNQLALTLAGGGESLGCIYYFVRCVFCKYPFKDAMESLVKHFDKVRVKYTEMARVWSHPIASKAGSKMKKTVVGTEQVKTALNEFFISFLRLIGIIFTKIDREQCKEVVPNTLAKLKICLEIFRGITDKKIRESQVEQFANVMVLLIFAVHFSVLGPVEKPSKQPEATELKAGNYGNKQALETDTGLISLNAFSDILSLLSTVIAPEYEETYSILLPACYWLTLNPDLREHLWAKQKNLLRSLSKIFKELSQKILSTETSALKPYLNEMLSDDYRLVGFIPLDEKILKKKTMTPDGFVAKNEGKVRIALIYKMLSEMNCDTFEEPVEEIKVLPTIKTNFAEIDVVARSQIQQIHEQVVQAQDPLKPSKPLIIIDVQNVAMRYGNGVFLCKGIEIAVDFWLSRGHKVVGFMPDYLLDERKVIELAKLYKANPASSKASKIPDNVSMLKEMHKKGIIVTTPSQDYDDTYCIEYAKKHGGYIVTNDKFRDHIEKFLESDRKKKESLWIKQHRIGFAFKGDEFLPNPDADFYKIYGEDEAKQMDGKYSKAISRKSKDRLVKLLFDLTMVIIIINTCLTIIDNASIKTNLLILNQGVEEYLQQRKSVSQYINSDG
eukprot:TRINITY_DN120186_c0_g1_i1.p1 TRINITY_DN120186_c0_g1~~TRINITY_DN120186_c0_g1_i1.p1  ORF type:complete len:897 (-),score=116.01 TRINITY_DN120186_c0_g1_i1:5354-8044(-)